MTEEKHLSFLIAGCRRMDEFSQMELYRHFYSYGMSICLRFAPSRESALEMLNDGFLKAFLKIDQYQENLPFKPWLRKILVNAAIDHFRKYHQQQIMTTEVPVEQSQVYNAALDQLEYEDLLLIIQALPAAYRLVFNLYVIEGLRHAEIAEQLKISVGTSKSNLARARQKIKELLSSAQGIHMKTE